MRYSHVPFTERMACTKIRHFFKRQSKTDMSSVLSFISCFNRKRNKRYPLWLCSFVDVVFYNIKKSGCFPCPWRTTIFCYYHSFSSTGTLNSSGETASSISFTSMTHTFLLPTDLSIHLEELIAPISFSRVNTSASFMFLIFLNS